MKLAIQILDIIYYSQLFREEAKKLRKYMDSQKIQYSKITANLLKVLPKRYQTILTRRYGLKGEKPETLESIGKDYKITRERVRQIEEAALRQLKNSEYFKTIGVVFDNFQTQINNRGGIRRESEILAELAGSSRNFAPVNFLLELCGRFEKIPESFNFHSFWMTDKSALAKAKTALQVLIDKLETKGVPRNEDEFQALGQSELASAIGEKIEEPALASYLSISKEIRRGPFGHVGLRHWPEINPRGIKDKAYLVLKRERKPLHFTAVAQLINKTNFPKIYLGAWRRKREGKEPGDLVSKKTNPQTVHNELIKDERFVLVGRGLYALKEWGYDRGIVKDVIKKVLVSSATPLDKEAIIAKVLAQRMVKANTVLCNLQDKNIFKRLDDGKYTIVG